MRVPGAPPPATFSLAHDPSAKVGRIATGGLLGSGPPQKQLPPGAEFVSKAAAKNAKKRAAKKGKEGEGEPAPGGGGSGSGAAAAGPGSAAAAAGSGGGTASSGRAGQAGGAANGAAAAAAVAGLSLGGGGSGGGAGGESEEARQKRVRALQKKLRQIQQLKEKRDAEGGWLRDRGAVEVPAGAGRRGFRVQALVLLRATARGRAPEAAAC
jgi:hypothetical protein